MRSALMLSAPQIDSGPALSPAWAVNVFEKLRRALALVAADAEGDYVAVAELDGEVEDLAGLFRAELADGVEDPEQRDAEVLLAAPAAALQAFEDGREILLAPEADADGNRDLGVQNVLLFQAFHQTVGDEFVVVGRAQVAGDVLEGEEEAGEIGVVVKPLDFGRGAVDSVALAEFEESCGLDGAFKMQVQFGLWKRDNETGRFRRHGTILKDG
jgi:hypothetical protein